MKEYVCNSILTNITFWDDESIDDESDSVTVAAYYNTICAQLMTLIRVSVSLKGVIRCIASAQHNKKLTRKNVGYYI